MKTIGSFVLTSGKPTAKGTATICFLTGGSTMDKADSISYLQNNWRLHV
jgi:hypothetical protein